MTSTMSGGLRQNVTIIDSDTDMLIIGCKSIGRVKRGGSSSDNPGHMPPEVITSQRSITIKIDYWLLIFGPYR